MVKLWTSRLQSLSQNYIKQNLGISNRVKCVCDRYSERLDWFYSKSFRMPRVKSNMVYANNHINLGQVKVLGFDLDYTLVTYTEELQNFIYEHAKNLLIQGFGFPKSMETAKFDKSFAIRGLSIDYKNGVLLKLSQLQRVGVHYAFRGKRPLTTREIENLYGESRHISHGQMTQLKPLHDLYSMAEGCLIADAMDHFDHNNRITGEQFSPASAIEDIQTAIKNVHTSGILPETIMNEPDKFINPSPLLADMLEHFRRGGKQIFLCTNSGYSYANKALSHVLKIPYSPSGNEWRDIFDLVICSASKPHFYFTSTPFRQWNTLTDSSTPILVEKMNKGSVYVQGSVHSLRAATGWMGKDVLYVGDNLRSDLQEATRWHGWHTGCVIDELKEEVRIQSTEQFQELHYLRSCTRAFLIEIQDILEEERRDRTEASFSRSRDFMAIDGDFIKSLQIELQSINSAMSACFNPNFGSIFRTDGHSSILSHALKRYADIYTDDVCNLLYYNPSHQFYPSQSVHMVSVYIYIYICVSMCVFVISI